MVKRTRRRNKELLLKVVFTNGEVLYKDSTLIEFVNEGVHISPSSTIMDTLYESGMAIVPFRNVLYIDPIDSTETLCTSIRIGSKEE